MWFKWYSACLIAQGPEFKPRTKKKKDKSHICIAGGKKPGIKEYILYDFIDTTRKIGKANLLC
jgi:hypothetical protein